MAALDEKTPIVVTGGLTPTSRHFRLEKEIFVGPNSFPFAGRGERRAGSIEDAFPPCTVWGRAARSASTVSLML